MPAFSELINFPNVSMVVSIILFISSFIVFGTQVGKQQNWAELKSAVTAIVSMNIVALVFMLIALFFYMTRYATMTHIINMILSSLALFASITALSISVISKTQD